MGKCRRTNGRAALTRGSVSRPNVGPAFHAALKIRSAMPTLPRAIRLRAADPGTKTLLPKPTAKFGWPWKKSSKD